MCLFNVFLLEILQVQAVQQLEYDQNLLIDVVAVLSLLRLRSEENQLTGGTSSKALLQGGKTNKAGTDQEKD